jgi:hypothetical protein
MFFMKPTPRYERFITDEDGAPLIKKKKKRKKIDLKLKETGLDYEQVRVRREELHKEFQRKMRVRKRRAFKLATIMMAVDDD